MRYIAVCKKAFNDLGLWSQTNGLESSTNAHKKHAQMLLIGAAPAHDWW